MRVCVCVFTCSGNVGNLPLVLIASLGSDPGLPFLMGTGRSSIKALNYCSIGAEAVPLGTGVACCSKCKGEHKTLLHYSLQECRQDTFLTGAKCLGKWTLRIAGRRKRCTMKERSFGPQLPLLGMYVMACRLSQYQCLFLVTHILFTIFTEQEQCTKAQLCDLKGCFAACSMCVAAMSTHQWSFCPLWKYSYSAEHRLTFERAFRREELLVQ